MRFDGGDAENWLEGMNSVQLFQGGGVFPSSNFSGEGKIARARTTTADPQAQ